MPVRRYIEASSSPPLPPTLTHPLTASSSISPSAPSCLIAISQSSFSSSWWSTSSRHPNWLYGIVAVVALVVVAWQRLRLAVHGRTRRSRAIMSQLPGRSSSPLSPPLQPYGSQARLSSQKRRVSYSRPLNTIPLVTRDRTWLPPPPMPTLTLLQSPPDSSSKPGARDEYYSTSPDAYDTLNQYAYEPFSAAPSPPPLGMSLGRASRPVQETSAMGDVPSSRIYHLPHPVPSMKTTILPPPHPDVTGAPLLGQALPSASAQRSQPPPPQPPPSRSHRRSYSQKIIYPNTYSPRPHSTSRSVPDLSQEMRDAGPLTAPGGTSAMGTELPDGEAMGIEVTEEIIVAAEGWRRHTRVYGGGVCMACLESEAEMKELGINLDAGPILMEGGINPIPTGQSSVMKQEQPPGRGESTRGDLDGDEGRREERKGDAEMIGKEENWWGDQRRFLDGGDLSTRLSLGQSDAETHAMGEADTKMSPP